MVKHVVMWKMKEGQNDPMIKKAMKENLEALNGEIKESHWCSIQIWRKQVHMM